MASTFFGLTISYTGLQAANTSLNVAAHNISNINTKGYSRQYVSARAADSIRTHSDYGTLGAGVKMLGVKQLRNSYYDSKYRTNQVVYGEYGAKESYMSQIEDYLDEWTLKGYCHEYDQFFTAVEGVYNTPSESSAKNSLINSAASFAQYFNTLTANLRSVQEKANDELKDAVEQINTYAKNIADLNRQINQVEACAGEANDLRDARNQLVDELSEIINVSTHEDDIGNGLTEFKMQINGQSIVSGYEFATLKTKARDEVRNASDAEGLYDIYWDSGAIFNMYSYSLGGRLRTLVDIRDGCNQGYEVFAKDDEGELLKDESGYNYLVVESDTMMNSAYKGIPYYQSQLNEFIEIFANAVNKITSQGYTSDGRNTGIPMFTTHDNTTTMTAQNITVNPELVANAELLATRFEYSTGEADGSIMQALRELQKEKIFDGGTGAYYLESIVSDVSIDSSKAKNLYYNYTNLRTTIDNQRLSVMGVDTDEEAMDMLKYQQAYNLNAKMMSVFQEIYNTLINGTGV